MSPQKPDLVAIGRSVSEKIEALGSVRATAFYGLIGLGYEREARNVKIAAYARNIPKPERRSSVLERRYEEFEQVMGHVDVLKCGGADIRVNYVEISQLEHCVRNLKGSCQEDWRLATFIQDVLPISGEKFISELRDRIFPYPDCLLERRKSKLSEVTEFFSNAKGYLEDHEFLHISRKLSEIMEDIAKVLYSINGIYYPGNLEWFDAEVERMKKVPYNFLGNYHRYTRISLLEDLPEKMEVLEEIFLDVLDLLKDREGIEIKSRSWYDEKIKEVEGENKKIHHRWRGLKI